MSRHRKKRTWPQFSFTRPTKEDFLNIMSKTGLLSIPDEILEDIFNQLDGKTFFNLRRINRRIKNLIDYILQRYDAKKWQNLTNNFFTVSSLFARGKYTRTGKWKLITQALTSSVLWRGATQFQKPFRWCPNTTMSKL